MGTMQLSCGAEEIKQLPVCKGTSCGPQETAGGGHMWRWQHRWCQERSLHSPTPSSLHRVPSVGGCNKTLGTEGQVGGVGGDWAWRGWAHTPWLLANRTSHYRPRLPQCPQGFTLLLSAAPDPWSQPHPSGDVAGWVWKGQLTSV